jgi:alanine racemase
VAAQDLISARNTRVPPRTATSFRDAALEDRSRERRYTKGALSLRRRSGDNSNVSLLIYPPAVEPRATHTRPVWAEISRARLLHNYRTLRALAGPDIAVAAVVKANAYGHGATLCAPWLAEAGAEWLGVTCVQEALAVRAVCPHARILVMSGLWNGEAGALLEHRLTPVVWESFHLDLLEAAARKAGRAPRSLPVHLEIDTGMSRQGIACSGLSSFLARFTPDSPLRLEAVMTHFYAPEVLDSPDTAAQIRAFATAVDTISSAGLKPALLHAGNSANLLSHHGVEALRALAARYQARLMLRPGLALYGYSPQFSGWLPPALPAPHVTIDALPRITSQTTEPTPADFPVSLSDSGEPAPPALLPVLSFKTRIVSLRHLAPGASAGYNATFRAEQPTRLALLPAGYADGISRRLSNRGHVLIHGRPAPIAGRVSMDQTIVDVTAIPQAAIGDEAILLGEQDGAAPPQSITAEDLASLCGTIPYEILTSIAARVPRVPVD